MNCFGSLVVPIGKEKLTTGVSPGVITGVFPTKIKTKEEAEGTPRGVRKAHTIRWKGKRCTSDRRRRWREAPGGVSHAVAGRQASTEGT